MKRALTFLFSGLAIAGAFAAIPARGAALTVAVYNFTEEKDAGNYGAKVTALVTADLTTETNLIMLDRETLDKALGEQALGASGLVNSQAAAKIGEITGVKVLVSGQVLRLDGNRLVIVANIVGTETSRLLAAEVEGSADKLEELTTDLSAKIGRVISNQAAELVNTSRETGAGRLERIVHSVTGKNRPTISVWFYHPTGEKNPSFTANTEMGLLLQRAGFVVVDKNSDRKPDVEISGIVDVDGQTHGDLHTEHAFVEAKVQDRRTGFIIAIDRQESTAVDSTQIGAQRSAQALAVDGIAERVLPLLAK